MTTRVAHRQSLAEIKPLVFVARLVVKKCHLRLGLHAFGGNGQIQPDGQVDGWDSGPDGRQDPARGRPVASLISPAVRDEPGTTAAAAYDCPVMRPRAPVSLRAARCRRRRRQPSTVISTPASKRNPIPRLQWKDEILPVLDDPVVAASNLAHGTDGSSARHFDVYPVIALQAGDDLYAFPARTFSLQDHRLLRACAFGVDAAGQDKLAHQVVLHRVRVAFQELLIVLRAAEAICMAGNQERFLRRAFHLPRHLVEHSHALGLQRRLAEGEQRVTGEAEPVRLRFCRQGAGTATGGSDRAGLRGGNLDRGCG